MSKGIVFSIEEFAVYDGPGARVNVFLKGCPLRCQWCHNPEGWDIKPQIAKNKNGCLGCGICSNVCQTPDACSLCGKCMVHCPRDLIRVIGTEYTAQALAEKLKGYVPLLRSCGGGITFSGGEVLMQSRFLCDVLDMIDDLNICIETCGYGSSEDFCNLLQRTDHVFYDIKIMDAEKHLKYTAKDNKLILQNAKLLMASGVSFTVRIPLVRGVNCDVENMIAVTEFFAQATALSAIELLPYNRFAGAKYSLIGRKYEHGEFEPPTDDELKKLREIIESAGMICKVRKSLTV